MCKFDSASTSHQDQAPSNFTLQLIGIKSSAEGFFVFVVLLSVVVMFSRV